MTQRQSVVLDGVAYAPGARFAVLRPGARLVGWVAIRGGSQGWVQELAVGTVLTCTGLGRGMGADPGRGVEFTSEASEAAGAFHLAVQPGAGTMWDYRPAPGYLAAADDPRRER